jgi:hypothetical protein
MANQWVRVSFLVLLSFPLMRRDFTFVRCVNTSFVVLWRIQECMLVVKEKSFLSAAAFSDVAVGDDSQ